VDDAGFWRRLATPFRIGDSRLPRADWCPEGWADVEANAMGYRTLVSRTEVPEWTPRPIKGIAFHRDLCATLDSPEVDEFERRIATEFKEPALRALERATTVGG
jgi:hypothetical protein